MLEGKSVVTRIIAMTPGLKQVTLFAVQPGEALTGGVTWTIKRKNADKELLLLAGAQIGANHRLFQLLRQDQTAVPQVNFTVQDWDGANWIIRHIDYKMADYVFDCLCLKNV